MFVPARPYRQLGDAQSARNFVDSIFPDWWLNWVGGPANTPLTPQEKLYEAELAVRSHGIDPATNRPISPTYAQTIQKNDKVDPNDIAAMRNLAAKIRDDQLAYVEKQFKNNTSLPAFPWGKVIGWGAVGLLGTIVLTKVM
jgi:hypothetical protein